ncbi:MAG: hypothetical protein EOP22_03315 [Hyphomicrobiales bacterium]|nr:MAG: hypothetical protein EOP22_03315 [Hyphomicrobiales bacterium]
MLKTILIAAFALLLVQPAAAAVKRQAYPLCADEQLRSCIENGLTFWYGGEHVRLRNAGVAATGGCSAATDRLRKLLNEGEVFVYRYGTNAEGLTLVEVFSQGREVGRTLAAEGLGCAIPS